MYAGRRRRKPVPRPTRPGPAEGGGGGSNPSKRHRERLNRELERLARLLPFPPDVAAGLDKLSVLRLSAGFLRARSFFDVALKNPADKEAQRDRACGTGPAPGLAAVPEGELLLQALNGFVLVVTSEGLIFYSSHTIQDYLGFHQADVMHQSVFELIHTEDHPEFRRNLHWALDPPHTPEGEPSPAVGKGLDSSAVIYKPDQLPPENSSFLERSFVCRFRCLLDNSSGFLALNLQGRLKFLHGRNKRSEDGSVLPPQLALFAISTPLQPPSILQIRTKSMIFRTKHKLDFTPLACDPKGKIILGYTEAELRMCGSGYQFVHAADTLYCAENHVRMMKTGESGLTVFRLLTKDNHWKWVQANARLVYKNGKPEYIVVTQRPLVDEEGGEYLRKRSMHLPFTFATGEALLYQSAHPLPGLPDLFQSKGKPSKFKKPSCSHVGRSQKNGIDPQSLLGKAVYTSHPAPTQDPSFSSTFQLGLVSLPSAGGDAWSMGRDPVSSRGNGLQEKLLENPLLATMDSLSVKRDESCSNKLFSALEGLGLNAEDLELLLLDEKMVMVSMDRDQSPSLNSLASNQILSYVPSCPVDEHEGEQQVCPLPGMPSSPQGGTAPCHTENKDSKCHLAQHAGQPSTALGQPPIPLWGQPIGAVPGLLPELAEQEELSSGSQWGLVGEETVLHFFQPAQGAPWDRAPSSALEAPCPQEPSGAQQLQGDFPAVQPSQEDTHQSFSLSSLCQGCVAPPGQRKHHHLLMNGRCGTSPNSSPHPSPWQDYVCPLLGSPARPGIYGLSQDLLSQPQGCLGPGPGLPPQHFNLNGLCSMEAVGTGDSWEEMSSYPRCSPPSYQLIPEKPLSPLPFVPQHPFPSSAAGQFGSIGSPLETSYGGHTSALSQEGRHKPHSTCGLPSSPMGLPQDCPVLGGSLALPCQPQLPDPPHASRGYFCL
ncbi:aryl hydrocarbon receptor-like isoform X1 [Hirundo rustica]|uniref:aryl hydrocarbon receptor-like isoform X1 n=1 Tax=Hirundo rustica TaxID=43150 RepID=UPI001A9528D8|nr:aryl hydrocarbon receptor-like isoform X1 [Hirundo rustica]XP_039925740.1 aryl hydrocarbon receptor-like isoform X1 [Hirundo rustica]XP_039925742.1 aryl hydrocarbon receptor-like isoform X1 [Hirundo rustica]XP_039925743.1 aryl hydrocarbon receptor-like isoform X1 [Hirundo rustica]XP_039925744.1 aryl hydrocarbon receptor-like isoform X1 [Hirundo rustica]